MSFFNYFKSSKHKKQHIIFNSIGKFTYNKTDETSSFEGIINSTIGKKIVLTFPTQGNEPSGYQTAYYKDIENNFDMILQQLKSKYPKASVSNYKITNILIPDQKNPYYDFDAEITFQGTNSIVSVILNVLNVEEIIVIQ